MTAATKPSARRLAPAPSPGDGLRPTLGRREGPLPRDPSGGSFRLRAVAAPIREIDGITTTIAAPAPVTFLNPPSTSRPVVLECARGVIDVADWFLVRFLSAAGAQRALFRCSRVVARPPMRIVVTASMLAEPAPAPSRGAPRYPVGLRITGTMLRAAEITPGARLDVEVVDISRSGACLELDAPLTVGDVVVLHATAADRAPHVGLEIVRRDLERRRRFGARFLDAGGGEALGSLLSDVVRSRDAESRLAVEQMERWAAALTARARERLARPGPADDERRTGGLRIHDEDA